MTSFYVVEHLYKPWLHHVITVPDGDDADDHLEREYYIIDGPNMDISTAARRTPCQCDRGNWISIDVPMCVRCANNE